MQVVWEFVEVYEAADVATLERLWDMSAADRDIVSGRRNDCFERVEDPRLYPTSSGYFADIEVFFVCKTGERGYRIGLAKLTQDPKRNWRISSIRGLADRITERTTYAPRVAEAINEIAGEELKESIYWSFERDPPHGGSSERTSREPPVLR